MIDTFVRKLEALEAWHAGLMDRQWLQPLSGRWYVVVVIIAISIAAYLNYHVRANQYEFWEQNPQIFALDDGTKLFTTADASYFVGLAQSIKRDGNFQTFNKKRLYPTNKNDLQNNPHPTSALDAPLLSSLIAFFADDSSLKALFETAHWLLPITAALTAIFITIAFGAAGYWLEGSLAATGGGLSLAYMTRSAAGRIDTDQLNLGFFYLMTGLVIFAARARALRTSLMLTIFAGAVMWVFNWWYAKPLFGWAFFTGLVWLSVVIHRDWKRTLSQAIIFSLISGLLWSNFGIGAGYLRSELDFGNLIFPNTFSTISELTVISFTEICMRISGSVLTGALCTIAFGLWCIRHPVFAVVFGPAAAFMYLNFLFGTRTVFFSAPLMWFALGWVFVTGVRFVVQFRQSSLNLQISAIICAIGAGFSFIWISSPTDYLTRPSFSKPALEGFVSLGREVSDKNSVVATWWDYGYASALLSDLNVLHDGGGQNTPVTHYVARALMTDNQAEAARMLSYFSTHTMKEFASDLSQNSQLDKEFSSRERRSEDLNVYLVLTAEMGDWMPSISKVGLWDPIAGKATFPRGTLVDRGLFYDDLKCQQTGQQAIIKCAGAIFNLKTGLVDDRPLMAGLVRIKDGKKTIQFGYENNRAPFVLHLIHEGDKPPRVVLVHRRLFQSLYHQLFFLNHVDERYFTALPGTDPDFKVFKLK